MKGKNILITGASSGIGKACALACSQLDANLILCGRNERNLKHTFNELEGIGQHSMYVFDLLNEEKVIEIVDLVRKDTGILHGVVHSAGISTTLPLRMIKQEKLVSYFQVNVAAAIELTKRLTKKSFIASTGASVVFISSVMGTVGEAGKITYSATKGALIAASKSMAIELAPRGIRINCISPGVVNTPMSQEAVYSQNEEERNKIEALHPLGIGTPEDVANTCVFLLSDASRWITGANLFVDGGYTAR